MFDFRKILFFSIIFVFCTLTHAQRNTIKSIDIRVNKGNLRVYTHLVDFLNKDLRSVIASGMSASFNFYFELIKVNDKILKEKEETIIVRNDVWEKKYLIKSSEFSKTFFSFADFRVFLFDSLHFTLGSINIIPKDAKLQFMVALSPDGISSLQKKKLKYWLNSNELNSQNKTGNPESSFSINISNLISFFFKEDNKKKIDIYKSKIFTIRSVMNDAQTPQ
jgi:hypothetical protein